MQPRAANQIPVACLAPPLTDQKLAAYKKLISAQPAGEVRDALETLLKCVEAWWALPESKGEPAGRWQVRHKGKTLAVPERKLDPEHVQALDAVTPWMRELDLLSNNRDTGLFDGLKGELRNAAFHLLWFAREITLDREPMTQDSLQGG